MTEPTEFTKARSHLRARVMALLQELIVDPTLNTPRVSFSWQLADNEGSRNEYSAMVELEVKEVYNQDYWVELVDEDGEQ